MDRLRYFLCLFVSLFTLSCEELDDKEVPSVEPSLETQKACGLTKSGVARLLSELPILKEQVAEVHDAVSGSVDNGYDEEYTMHNLFTHPGAPVGTKCFPTPCRSDSAKGVYNKPLKDMISNHIKSLSEGTRADSDEAPDLLDGMSPDDFLKGLSEGDMQIYWPNSDLWDGNSLPTITFEPEGDKESNDGYLIEVSKEGRRSVRNVMVDEEYSKKYPVWVVNSNRDSGYETLEMLRKEYPSLDGGSLVIPPKPACKRVIAERVKVDQPVKTLILKQIRAKKQFDSWFAGGSEYWFKIGSVENFTASTEAELKLYNPSVTDFLIVVPRRDVGKTLDINTVLVSDWTEQLTNCAFLIIEDDGGKKTSWKCEAVVKWNSKSYGFVLDIPYSRNDDIVWRGQLSRRYLDAYETQICQFGEMEVVFEFI